MRRLSDRICLENDLSVITDPKLHSKGRFLHYGAWLGTERKPSYKEQLRRAINEALANRPADFDAFLRLMEASGYTVKHGRGGALSFLVPGQERATRLRATTLGDGYDPEDIKAVIAREHPIPEQPVPVPAPPRRVNLIVDIQERLRSGKGAAYARWAKVYNLKQMAAALQFMQEQNITEYDQLSAKAENAVSRFHTLTEQLRRTEADLSATSELMGAVVQYAIVVENCRIGRDAQVGAPPETVQDPDDWGVAVLGPGTVIEDGEIVSAKTLLDRHHGEVKA